MKRKKENRGGARKGAGRKPSGGRKPTGKRNVAISEGRHFRLKIAAKTNQKSIVKTLAEILDAAI